MSEVEPRAPLEVLDPAIRDPGYWERFQRRVMAAARPHLAERSRAEVTVEDIMVSWGRLILPLAAAAVAAAVLLSARGNAVDELGGVQEALAVPVEGEPLPAFLHSDEVVDRDLVLFAVEGF